MHPNYSITLRIPTEHCVEINMNMLKPQAQGPRHSTRALLGIDAHEHIPVMTAQQNVAILVVGLDVQKRFLAKMSSSTVCSPY